MKATGSIDFSVIVPSYNRAALLRRALDSILEQTFAAREIIVIDDGSSDATARLIRECYPQVRYRYLRHSGVSAARNLGIRDATGNWIALLDSDDFWTRGKLAAQAELIRRTPALRWLHTNETWVRNGVTVRQKALHEKAGGDIFSACLRLCCVSPSTVAVRRDVFAEIGLFDETLKACEDYDLWLRIAAHEPIGFIAEPLVLKCDGHPGQLSHRIPALDRYRIRALAKLLCSGRLSPAQVHKTRQALQHKAGIFVAGARKRGHHVEAANVNAIVRKLTDVRST